MIRIRLLLFDVAIHVHREIQVVKGLVGDADEGDHPASIPGGGDVFAPREHGERGRRAVVEADGVAVPLVTRELVPVADAHLRTRHDVILIAPARK